MEINNYCSKIYNLCLNFGKTSNLVDTNSLFEKNDLLFLRNTNSENILTEIIPNYKLADGFQLFFNYLSKLLNLNILYLVNYFFYSIIILTFGSLLYSIHKSNLNNKLILITTTTLFYLSNIYLYNYNAEYLIYSISSILPLIFLIQFYYNKKQINLIYLFSFSFLAIIIFGTMRYYSYLSFLLISLILVLTLKKSFFKKTFFVISIIILLLLKIFFFHNVEEIRKNNALLLAYSTSLCEDNIF